MTPEHQNALALVAQAASLARLSAQEHAAVQQAVRTLEAALTPTAEAAAPPASGEATGTPA